MTDSYFDFRKRKKMTNGTDALTKMDQPLADAFMIVKEMRAAKLIVSTSSRHDKRSVPARLKWINFQSAY